VTTAAGERTTRAARARAQAAQIIDAPRVPRRLVMPEGAVLSPSHRRRLHAPRARPAAPQTGSRRRVAAVLVVAQLGLLVALFLLPAFRASRIYVEGTRLLSRAAVLAAAGISSSQSIFTVDGEAIQARLERLPWVRSASVETELPGTVRISITEWAPILRVHDSYGDRLVGPGGASLDIAPDAAQGAAPVPLLRDERPSPAALSPLLARALAAVAQIFTAAVGTPVSSFDWQPDSRLAIVTVVGWRAILGRLDGDDQVRAIPAQIAALVALQARLNLLKPNFGYIDLTDVNAPAVGGQPGQPQPQPADAPQQAVGPWPMGGPAPPPTPTPQPTPSPTPTPKPTPVPLRVGGPASAQPSPGR